jgi:hypothetical protein
VERAPVGPDSSTPLRFAQNDNWGISDLAQNNADRHPEFAEGSGLIGILNRDNKFHRAD